MVKKRTSMAIPGLHCAFEVKADSSLEVVAASDEVELLVPPRVFVFILHICK